jgi:hypothetical protein
MNFCPQEKLVLVPSGEGVKEIVEAMKRSESCFAGERYLLGH